MSQASGRQVLAAAAIVGAAVIGASLLLANSLDRATSQLEEIRAAVADAKGALANLQPAPTQQARKGLDPTRRYQVSTKGAPTIGPAKAAVTLVEFSDFQ